VDNLLSLSQVGWGSDEYTDCILFPLFLFIVIIVQSETKSSLGSLRWTVGAIEHLLIISSKICYPGPMRQVDSSLVLWGAFSPSVSAVESSHSVDFMVTLRTGPALWARGLYRLGYPALKRPRHFVPVICKLSRPFFLLLAVLGMAPRAPHKVSKCSTTEPHHRSTTICNRGFLCIFMLHWTPLSVRSVIPHIPQLGKIEPTQVNKAAESND
jgi:hypothetical protein